MKALAVLLLSWIPLAMVAAETFFPTEGPPQASKRALATEFPQAADAAVRGKMRAEVEKNVARKLLQTDWFAAEPIAELDRLPEGSVWRAGAAHPLPENWFQWGAVRHWIDEYLVAEQAPSPTNPAAIRQSIRVFESLRRKAIALQVVGAAPMSSLIDLKVNALAARIRTSEQDARAQKELVQIEGHFHKGEFDACAALCQGWLKDYPGTVQADLVTRVKRLQRQSEFSVARKNLEGSLPLANQPEAKATLLETFARKFSGWEDLSDEQKKYRADKTAEATQLRQDIGSRTAKERAKEEVDHLRSDVPGDFNALMTRAEVIARKYPEPSVRAMIQEEMSRWLVRSLPLKYTADGARLEEAIMKDGRVLRGYFQAVNLPQGTGYKRYDTLDASLRPTGDQGVLGPGEFSQPPARSLPVDSVQQYERARQTILAAPWRKSVWEEFAKTCQALQKRWADYRRRPGASSESISFQNEEQFSQDVLANADWDQLGSFWGK